jgi:hypothetical protein
MKTQEEVRARLAAEEAKFEAEVYATSGCLNPTDKTRAMNLERLGSWAGALRWVLNEEAER